MRLYRTTCHTDWKGRPDHNLEDLGLFHESEAIEEAIAKDIAQGMAETVVREFKGDLYEWDENDHTEWEDLVAKYKKDSDLEVLWKEEDKRWKMDDADELVEKFDDGSIHTTAYHILP